MTEHAESPGSRLVADSDIRPFPLEEYEERWKRVHEHMTTLGHEVAVVWGKTSGVYERAGDVLYLTNFFSTHSGQEPDTTLWNARSYCAVILQPGQSPELVTDETEPRYDQIATDRFSGLYDPIAGLARILRERQIEGRVAFVGSDCLPMKYWLQLRAATPQIDWVVEDDLVRDVRLIKSARELALYREAGEYVTRAHVAMMEALIAGKSESEAASRAGALLLERGCNWHRMAISHGAVSQYLESDPINGFSTRTPQAGDIVHGFIYGPIYKGYWLDPGRTAVCGGRPTADQKHLIETLADVMEKLMAAIRPGVAVMDVARLADDLSEKSGYQSDVLKTAWPYYGHSVGCMWEAPYIETRLCNEEDVFLEDMVHSVEAFFEADGVGTATFETNFIVTDTGVDEITTTPHVFW